VTGLARYGAALALLALVLVNAALTPGFLALATLWNIGLQVSTTVIVAIGMTLVIATGGIDLSVGAIMAIASVVLATELPHGAVAAATLGLLAALGFGFANGALVGRYGVPPIIVTLAGLIMGRGIAQVIVEGNPLVAFNHPGFERLGQGALGPLPVPVLITGALVAAARLVLKRTTFGRWVIATGGNERAARLAGVPVAGVKLAVYAVSGLLAGLAGLIETARLAATDAGRIGLGMELDAIVAVVVGGTPLTGGRASLQGTIAGASLMGVLTASFNMRLIAPAWSLIVKAAILIVAVWLQRGKGG
jgi:simple sugar transport system permease protein/ribose transport system permease protein